LGLPGLSREIEESIAQGREINGPCKLRIKKMANAGKNAFADRAILLDENPLLCEQNNKKTTCNSIKAIVVGSARVLSYEDIVKAQKKRDEKKAGLKQRS
jgi:hypothetical protein